jgi:AraC family transcriptional regulator
LVVHFLKGAETMKVEKKQLPAMRLATVHHVGAYSRISEAFGRLGDIAGRAGLFEAKPTMLALYHDDPESTPEGELQSEAAVVVAEGVSLPEGLTEQRIVAGRYACTTHIGPYEQLGDVWARFMGHWLPESGERMGPATSFEIYVNNPMDVPKDQLITDLYIPLS